MHRQASFYMCVVEVPAAETSTHLESAFVSHWRGAVVSLLEKSEFHGGSVAPVGCMILTAKTLLSRASVKDEHTL